MKDIYKDKGINEESYRSVDPRAWSFRALLLDHERYISCYIVLKRLNGKKCGFFTYRGCGKLYLVNIQTYSRALYDGSVLFGLYDWVNGKVVITDAPKVSGRMLSNGSFALRYANLLELWRIRIKSKDLKDSLEFAFKSRNLLLEPPIWLSKSDYLKKKEGGEITAKSIVITFDSERYVTPFSRCFLYLIN